MASLWAAVMGTQESAEPLNQIFVGALAGPDTPIARVLAECSFGMQIGPDQIPQFLIAKFISTDKPTTIQGNGQPTTYEKLIDFLRDNAALLGN